MHNWGEENVDWAGINDAAEYLGTSMVRWGRMNVRDWKEKWGTVRVYVDFGWHQMHNITHPRYVYSQYPKWLWYFDCKYLSKLVRLLNPIVIPYHLFLYQYFYGRALKKWPHLRLEILRGADHNKLLTRYGVHVIRTGERIYEIRYDWHPDNSQSEETE